MRSSRTPAPDVESIGRANRGVVLPLGVLPSDRQVFLTLQRLEHAHKRLLEDTPTHRLQLVSREAFGTGVFSLSYASAET
jgi:hypothetical protein